MTEFLKLFAITLLFPILPMVICGLIVGLSERLFSRLTGKFGRGVVMATSLVGTPIHELGHALMCFPFGHKIKKMCLWNPKAPNGVLGYVNHTYNKKNLWHRLGCLFISLGPIILGLGVVTLAMLLSFPQALEDYYHSALSVDRSVSGAFELVRECIKIIPSAVTDASSPVWARACGALVILCVCMHISLSPADIKNSIGALPMYSVICLVLSLVIFFIGGETAQTFADALSSWCFIGFALYMVVFAGVIFMLAIGALCYVLGKIFGK